MRQNPGVSRLLALFTLMALPFLVGSSCFFAFSSGDGSGGVIVKDDDDDDDDEEEEEPRIVQTGMLGGPAASGVAASGVAASGLAASGPAASGPVPSGPAIAGVGFASDSLAGVTGGNGEFRYIEGESVRFFIGDITLGVPVAGRSVISPGDLAAGDSHHAAAAINIARLLHSLDADPDDDTITIPAAVRAAAVRPNPAVSAAIEFLDFTDEAAFTNAASQLVAALTQEYAHTATLVDAEAIEGGNPASPDDDLEP